MTLVLLIIPAELAVYGHKHMHTPNFDRLASRSIVFDAAYAQIAGMAGEPCIGCGCVEDLRILHREMRQFIGEKILDRYKLVVSTLAACYFIINTPSFFFFLFCSTHAVCSPSRHSMLTGQRPDSSGVHNFESQSSNINIPSMFSRNGYITAGYGKILHKEYNFQNAEWNFEQFNNNWYKVQNQEDKLYMNASVTPDRHMPESEFPDYIFTSRAIKTIQELVMNKTRVQKSHKPFMLGLGYKLPHLALHVPARYFDMYREQAAASRQDQSLASWPYHFSSTADLSFPPGAPEMGHSVSNYRHFLFMRDEGASKSTEHVRLRNEARLPFPKRAHLEV